MKAFDRLGRPITVSEERLGELERLGGRAATPDEVREAEYGDAGGQLTAGLLGVGEGLTGGRSTAAMSDLGKILGGDEGRRSVEEAIKGYERTNPISHVAGQLAPMVLVPEAAGELLPEIAGGSLAARAFNFAAPRFVEGVAQDAWLQGTQGISEDALDHPFTAQSFLGHAAAPEVLIGGVANVGLGAAGRGVKKAFGRAFGRAGEAALEDGLASEAVTAAAQRAGRTSDEAAGMFSSMQDLAQQAAAVPEKRGFFDRMAQAHAEMVSGGDKQVASALRRAYAEATDRFAGAERVLDRSAKEAMQHSDELFKGLRGMNELQFGLKESNVRKLVDPARVTEQIDAALTARREIGQMLDAAASGVDVRAPEVKKVWDTITKLDGVVREAVDANAAGLGTKAAESAAREAGAKVYTALDDAKRVIGRAAKFGQEAKDGSAQLAEAIYEQRLRPLLESEGLWGRDLARMQAQTNASFADGFQAYRRYQQAVGQVLSTPGGKPLHTTSLSGMRSVLSELEHATELGNVTGLRAEVLQRVVENTRSRAASMIETMDLTAAQRAGLKRTVDAATRLEKTVQRAHGEALDFRTLKELKAREVSAGSGMGAFGGAVVGSAGGPAGAAALGIVKGVTGAISSPVRTQQILGGLQRTADAVKKIISKDARSLLTGERILSASKSAPTRLDREATKAAMLDLLKAAADPQILKERVRRLVSGIGDVAPGVGTSVAVTAARLVTYLASEVPPPLPPRFLETEPRYADRDVDEFQRKLDAALKPLTAFERMQAGRFRQSDQKMLKSVYDELYTEMQTSLLKEYKAAKAKGTLKAFSAQEREMLSFMLETPLEGRQQPDFVARMQEAAMSDPNAQGAVGASAQGGGRPRRVQVRTDDLETYADKISS